MQHRLPAAASVNANGSLPAAAPVAVNSNRLAAATVATSGSPPTTATAAAVSDAVTAVARATKAAAVKDAAAKEAARSRAAAHRASVDSSVARDTRRAALRRFRKKRPLPAAGRDYTSSVTPGSTPGSSSDAVDLPSSGGVGGSGGSGSGAPTGRGEPIERLSTGGIKAVPRRAPTPMSLPPTPPDRTPTPPGQPAGSGLLHLPGTWREHQRVWHDARAPAVGPALDVVGRAEAPDGPALKRPRPVMAALSEGQVGPILAAPWDQLPNARAGWDGVHVPSSGTGSVNGGAARDGEGGEENQVVPAWRGRFASGV
ncbi:hypothetical protein MMPV_004135 [Pyropia vietnamensis]